MLLVEQVEGPEAAAPCSCCVYRCVGFNRAQPSDAELQRINWVVTNEEERPLAHFPLRGPQLEFAPMHDLAGRLLFVRPYINQPTERVQVATRIADAQPAPPAPASTPALELASNYAPAPAPVPATVPAPVSAPVPARQPPISLDLSLQGNRYYAAPPGGPRLYVGTGVTYGDRRGLMTLETQPGANWDVAAARERFGHWASIIAPTAACESKGRYTCLNTYDRARFTFGLMQWAAHTPDANFVLLLRRLLELPSAARLFPDLTLVDGRIAQRSDGRTTQLESQSSTAALQDYLNPSPDTVGRQEALTAAKFVYWALDFDAHRETQLAFAVDDARQRIAAYARRYDLDGQRDDIVVVVFDIRHQGRASSDQIRAALAADDPLEALLRLGADRYPQRVRELRARIDADLQAGVLGCMTYDAAHADWRAIAIA